MKIVASVREQLAKFLSEEGKFWEEIVRRSEALKRILCLNEGELSAMVKVQNKNATVGGCSCLTGLSFEVDGKYFAIFAVIAIRLSHSCATNQHFLVVRRVDVRPCGSAYASPQDDYNEKKREGIPLVPEDVFNKIVEKLKEDAEN